ncbi:MAG: hypothetical protein ACE5PM_03485 [Candidatus Hydrothermarchaeales archaeon]
MPFRLPFGLFEKEKRQCAHCEMEIKDKAVEMFGKDFCSEDHAYKYMTGD